MDEMQKQKLLDYLRDEFPEPMSSHFTYDLVENVITYADDNLPRDMVLYHIAEMIPEVTAKELEHLLEEE